MAANSVQRVAAGILVWPDAKVFIGKRKDLGKWEFPGGKCEKGESPYLCLNRELKEELSLDLTETKPDRFEFLTEYAANSELRGQPIVLYFYLIGFNTAPKIDNFVYSETQMIKFEDYANYTFLKTNLKVLADPEVSEQIHAFIDGLTGDNNE